MVRTQCFEKLAGDAHGQGHGNARREANRFDRGDGANAREKPLEAIGRHRERIASAYDDVAHVRVRLDPGEGRLEFVERGCAAAIADHA